MRLPPVRSPGFATSCALAVVAGLGMAAQARINGALAARLDDGVAAAVVSFGTGEVVLVVLALAVRPVRDGLAAVRRALATGELRPWHVLGGAGGALLVVCQGLTVTAIGVAVFTVAMVAGQAGASLLVDRFGVGPVRAPVNAMRTAGAALALVAVAVAVLDRFGTPSVLALTLLPALAGAAIAWQQGVHGRVNLVSRQPLATAVLNFTVGLALLLVAAAVVAAVRGLPAQFPAEPVLYLGGPIGVVAVCIGAAVAQVVGVLVLGLGIVAGQLTGAVVLDLWIPADVGQLSVPTLAGSALALLAVAVVAAGSTRSGGRRALGGAVTGPGTVDP